MISKWYGKDLRLGVLGGGQLGRMIIQAANDLNIHIHCLDPDPNAPCSEIAHSFSCGSLTDFNTVLNFGSDKHLITVEIENVNVDALVEAVGRTARISPVDEFDAHELANTALQAMSQSFDTRWGGFGSAPKFPSTFALDLAMRSSQRSHDDQLLGMVNTSLDAMAAGGMYDHIGGGFSRYSVDEKWLVPHFEKMLYDNAQLVSLYSKAYQLTRNESFKTVVTETLDFIDKALEKSPENFRYGLLKAKIQAKNNNGKGALITVKIANQWAKSKKNDNYIEQTNLFWQSLLNKK